METRRPIAVGILLLGLVAIAATAGLYAESTGPTFGGDVTGGEETDGGNDQTGLPGWLISNFYVVLMAAAVLFLVVATLAVLWLRGREGLEMIGRFVAENAVAVGMIIGLLLLTRATWAYFSTSRSMASASGTAPGGESSGARGAAGASAGSEALPTIWILISIYVLAGVVMYFALQRRQSGGTTGGGAPGTGRSPPPEPVDGGDGPALQIEDVSTSNAVYRAWTDLRDRLDRRGHNPSPADLRREALAAGYDERAVGELTALFNTVRYGSDDASPEQERRARDLQAELDGEDGEVIDTGNP